MNGNKAVLYQVAFIETIKMSFRNEVRNLTTHWYHRIWGYSHRIGMTNKHIIFLKTTWYKANSATLITRNISDFAYIDSSVIILNTEKI